MKKFLSLLVFTALLWGGNADAGLKAASTPTNLPVSNGGTGVNSNTLVQSFDYVPRATLLPRWTAALNRARSGKGHATVLGFGDSQTAGKYAATDGTAISTTNYLYNYPARLMGYFQAQGFSAYQDGIYGNDSGANVRVTEDARLTSTGSFATCGNIGTLGNTYFCATTTGTLTYKPNHPVNSITIWYGTYSGGGTFSYQIDGGSTTNVVTNNASLTNASVVITPALGTHTLTINYVSGSEVYIDGVDAANTSLPTTTGQGWIDFQQTGVSGANACDLATQTTNQFPIGVITSLAPDLVILEAGQNDLINGTTVAATAACLQTVITALLPNMDVAIIDQIPLPTTGSTNLSQTTQDSWSAAVKQLGITNKIPVIDIYDAWGANWLTLEAYDYYGSTTAGTDASLHPGPNGYPTYAQDVFYVVGANGNLPSPYATGPTATGVYTVSTLPTGFTGMRAFVTDQATACPVVGGTLTGSGAVGCPVVYNGTAWVGG